MGTKSAVDEIGLAIKKRISSQMIIAFISCCVVGVMTYGYFMTHHFVTYDSMWNLYSKQDAISSGRQFLTYACAISSYYDFPYLNGILAIFYLAITAVIIVELFQIKNGICAALVSGLLVAFPSVISTFCYTYTVDGYMLAVLLITLALLITERKKYGFIGGAILLGISLGIYQAYLSYVMLLCVMLLLLQILEAKKIKDIWIKIGRYVCMGGGGYAFYLLTLHIMMAIKGVSLSGYQGTDAISGFSFSLLPKGILTAYKKFFAFLLTGKAITVNKAMTLAVTVMIILGVCIYLYLFGAKKCGRNLWKIFMTGVLVLSIPLCGSIISVISPDAFYHTLMWYSWCVPFLFVIVLVERMSEYSGKREGLIKKWVTVTAFVSCAILIFEFSKTANLVGFNMEERYEKNYAIALRIVERLEETPGYQHGMKVAILGGEPSETIFPPTEITGGDLRGYFGSHGDYSLNSSEKFAVFMAHYMNVTLRTIDESEEIALTYTEEFLEMPYFPDSDSIRKIDDVWVVKLNG